MTSRFIDKFARADGEIGDNYTVVCGGVLISDEAVIPVNAEEIISGFSPLLPNVTSLKTQVLYTGDTMDGPNYVVRGTWAHDGEEATGIDPNTVDTPSSFTLLARMTKDPLLYDLGTDEDPLCYDQGYGARVTMPRDGTAPTLKIIKYMPARRLPNLDRPSSVEVDGMVVLASAVLDPDDLNLDPDFDGDDYVSGTSVLPYRGLWQDMRLRIRRTDSEVFIDVYLNDRNLNQPKLSYTDKVDPLWGAIGVPGFEFLSGKLVNQPVGVSPFSLTGLSLLRCGVFSCETFADVHKPVSVAPGGAMTYTRVVNRVITLVEKDGDAKYNASTGGQTKFDTYLQFVLEAEADIIRKEGYYQWLRKEERIYLSNSIDEYEMPANFGELEFIRPGNWNGGPLREVTPFEFFTSLQGATQAGGTPQVFYRQDTGPNDILRVKIYPCPLIEQVQQPGQTVDPYMIVAYYARQLWPDEPDVQLPFVPANDIDVLIYGAAAHALLLDTDQENAANMGAVYLNKLRDLRRRNNRLLTNRVTMRSAADVYNGNLAGQIPLTRAASLNQLLAF